MSRRSSPCIQPLLDSEQSSNVTALAQRLQNAAGARTNEGKGGLFGKDMGKMLGQMMKDPAMREMRRGQQKSMPVAISA